MLVKNLVPWAGANFSFVPGDIIDLPDDVAEARKAAGLAEDPPAADAGAPAKTLPGGDAQHQLLIDDQAARVAASANGAAPADAGETVSPEPASAAGEDTEEDASPAPRRGRRQAKGEQP